MATALRVLGIVGSLRTGAYNASLMNAAAALAPPGVTIDRCSLADIPVYNQDVEAHGDPAAVASLRAAVRDASALLVASPEYNYGVPGVLKNAIDWISRPPGKSPLPRKPVAIMGVSSGPSGTMRMQIQLRVTMQALDMYAMPKPEISMSFCKDKFDADGRLTDPKTLEHLKAFMLSFAEWARRFVPPTS